MAGDNLSYTTSTGLWRLILQALSRRRYGHNSGTTKLCIKNGAPASNVADDEPESVHDICYDRANDDVYISTAHTDETTHTWTKING